MTASRWRWVQVLGVLMVVLGLLGLYGTALLAALFVPGIILIAQGDWKRYQITHPKERA